MPFGLKNSIEQHFKHLQIVFYITKKNGLVVPKIKNFLFQTRVHFLDHYIS